MVAPDLRGHGLTTSAADADFAATTLAADVVAIWRALYATPRSSPSGDGVGADEEARDSAAAGETADPPPPIVIVGHSMGGVVAVRAAALDGERVYHLRMRPACTAPPASGSRGHCCVYGWLGRV